MQINLSYMKEKKSHIFWILHIAHNMLRMLLMKKHYFKIMLRLPKHSNK